jgi:hypothetical protein
LYVFSVSPSISRVLPTPSFLIWSLLISTVEIMKLFKDPSLLGWRQVAGQVVPNVSTHQSA